MPRYSMPKGFRDGGKHGPKVAILFQEELFERIAERATKDGKTFSAMVCELCQVGLLDLDESDQHERNESCSAS